MKNTYWAGLFSEFVARMFLRMHGFAIVESRHITGRYTHRAEIDIIARRKNLILFIEVKNRQSAVAGIRAVAPAQHVRLRRAATTYLAQKKWMGDARFDIIVVRGLRCEWFRGAV